jgi:ATP-dependent 26S proteasome regulatory subunit
VSYSVVGGLSDQIWELRESIELSLMNFELFMHVGIKPPKVLHNLVFSIEWHKSRVLICDCC